jgi:hypothetical protein
VPRVYNELLGYLARLREEKDVWVTIPGEVNYGRRQRAEMNLVENGEKWRIERPAKERARLAYANEEDGRPVLSLEADPEHETRLTYHLPSSALK